ncbi:hypothetical protein OS493_033939 [Desmophyllum pertusum]|uniref:Uncharacterized protein n=1 Tax=Desmophyllum pertusum TaxID=174260 RepID=A0A9W9ZWA8_9CNID|nr:hypothetical protein OS493_033939 [Desmophyllum pertusum]
MVKTRLSNRAHTSRNTDAGYCKQTKSTPSSINSSDSDQERRAYGANTGSYDKLVRWEDAHVKLLIGILEQKFKPLFKGKKTKKEIFDLIAFELNKNCKEKVYGDQCLRKNGEGWSVNHKEVEDHNRKTGNESKGTVNFMISCYECLNNEVSINPACYNGKSTAANVHFPRKSFLTKAASDEGPEAPQMKKKGCRKRPKSRYFCCRNAGFPPIIFREKRKKVEEEKLKIVPTEMKQEKKEFFDKFLNYLEKKQ